MSLSSPENMLCVDILGKEPVVTIEARAAAFLKNRPKATWGELQYDVRTNSSTPQKPFTNDEKKRLKNVLALHTNTNLAVSMATQFLATRPGATWNELSAHVLKFVNTDNDISENQQLPEKGGSDVITRAVKGVFNAHMLTPCKDSANISNAEQLQESPDQTLSKLLQQGLPLQAELFETSAISAFHGHRRDSPASDESSPIELCKPPLNEISESLVKVHKNVDGSPESRQSSTSVATADPLMMAPSQLSTSGKSAFRAMTPTTVPPDIDTIEPETPIGWVPGIAKDAKGFNSGSNSNVSQNYLHGTSANISAMHPNHRGVSTAPIPIPLPETLILSGERHNTYESDAQYSRHRTASDVADLEILRGAPPTLPRNTTAPGDDQRRFEIDNLDTSKSYEDREVIERMGEVLSKPVPVTRLFDAMAQGPPQPQNINLL